MSPHLAQLQHCPNQDEGWSHCSGQNRHRGRAESENHHRREAYHPPIEMQDFCEQGILLAIEIVERFGRLLTQVYA